MEVPNDIQGLRELVIQLLERVEKLEAENTLLKAENAQLKAENAQLKAENAELREKLNLKSHNSNKPPSSDGLSKKSVLPKTKGNNQGGQFFHRGKTLQRSDNPDQVIVHHAERCRRCGRQFSLADVGEIVGRRQVFEIPEPKIEVIEHQLGEISCCGEKHYGRFPKGVEKAVQYGQRIKALAVMLNVDYRLPLWKIEKLVIDLWGGSFNQSTILQAIREASRLLEPVEQQIKEELLHSPINHYDETGARVEGRLHWVHVVSNRFWTYLFVHGKRGREALESEKWFGSYEQWETEFKKTANALSGGSGWTILALNLHTKQLHNYWAADHAHNPPFSLPLLVLDMYEHSYQMDYGAAAGKYVDAFMQNVNWDEVNRRLETNAQIFLGINLSSSVVAYK